MQIQTLPVKSFGGLQKQRQRAASSEMSNSDFFTSNDGNLDTGHMQMHIAKLTRTHTHIYIYIYTYVYVRDNIQHTYIYYYMIYVYVCVQIEVSLSPGPGDLVARNGSTSISTIYSM